MRYIQRRAFPSLHQINIHNSLHQVVLIFTPSPALVVLYYPLLVSTHSHLFPALVILYYPLLVSTHSHLFPRTSYLLSTPC